MEAVIVDSGGANLASLCYALERLGARAQVSADARTIAGAARVVLPGVGAAAHAMQRLHGAGLTGVLRELTQPVLACAWGCSCCSRCPRRPHRVPGLLPYAVRRLSGAPGHPVPHMGWNQLCRLRPDPLLEVCLRVPGLLRAQLRRATDRAHARECRVRRCGIRGRAARELLGTQFHPERSAATGARVLENFLRL